MLSDAVLALRTRKEILVKEISAKNIRRRIVAKHGLQSSASHDASRWGIIHGFGKKRNGFCRSDTDHVGSGAPYFLETIIMQGIKRLLFQASVIGGALPAALTVVWSMTPIIP